MVSPDLRQHTNLREIVLESADRAPGATALVMGSRAWSYEELLDTARRWASVLIDAAGGPPRRVGVLSGRGEGSYIGILSALLAGAAFVPLNRKFPAERTRFMIESAELDALIVDEPSLPQLSELMRRLQRPLPVLAPSSRAGALPPEVTFGPADLERAPPLRDLPAAGPDDIAYLLFTSGSTGAPKGVPIRHRNVLSFLETNRSRYRLSQGDRLSQTFDLTFDLSIFDMFMAWGSGASLFPLEPIELLAPVSFIEKHELTVWFSVPSVAALSLRQDELKPGSMPSLRWSLFCGEALPEATAAAWQAAAPRSVLENLYGPTELTIACSAYRWDPSRSPAECHQGLVPIGWLYDGLTGLVVDESLAAVPEGQAGELCVAGPQTFGGYWRAPELTGERLFSRRTEGGETLLFYRTGDLVRRLPNGAYAYLGRSDHQVKIGGYRVELGEVEAAMRRAGCVEAVALAWPSAAQPDSIMAFVAGPVDSTRVKQSVRNELPGYMVPRAFHQVEKMPLNANGKIDREALRRLVR